MKGLGCRLVWLLGLACAQGGDPLPAAGTGRSIEEPAFEYALPESGPIDLDTTFLQPNVEDVDGVAAYVHVTPADMPLRVAVGYPRVPARYGSKAGTRDVAVEAMRMWEDAIQPVVPWFELAFVEKDPSAPVQIVWKSRIIGPWGGFGGVRHWVEGTELRVGGVMEVSTTPYGSLGPDARLDLDEIRLLVAHEFGHVLGLRHCLDCDSAMNYAWHTRDRVLVTVIDALTFAALVEQPNGMRVDGRRLSTLP